MESAAEPEPGGAALPLGGGRLPAHVRDRHGLHLGERRQQAVGIHHLAEETRLSSAREPRAGWGVGGAPGPARSQPWHPCPSSPLSQRRGQAGVRPCLQRAQTPQPSSIQVPGMPHLELSKATDEVLLLLAARRPGEINEEVLQEAAPQIHFVAAGRDRQRPVTRGLSLAPADRLLTEAQSHRDIHPKVDPVISGKPGPKP